MPAPRVLIVDHNELNLRLAETILTHAGFAITAARTAGEARGELARGTWDALLIDLRLPDGDGMEIVRRLRDSAITKPLEVR